ncbi:sugar transferase [Defluviimonas sp. WL0050]|uniref:Sugar transferase n=1 Tax=Albidovulum litorale TaxID=2984134 RepID=A0ABT2ZT90_9RHOB|nr:sugar transferase [Defluviimonas sp. WL0050]MCV2874165.1 sugar transferase [Defluviimonas sp. WL0050]
MTPNKRLFDIGLALLLLPVIILLLALVAIVIFCFDGRPVMFASERMQTPNRSFTLWKFRTMRPARGGMVDFGVSGGHKANRITTTGRVLRRLRLDELPQIYNILRGDMSFVGPRPPLRCYVESYPALYSAVLKARPGVTGLASLLYHRREEQLLSACRTAEETDRIYRERCIPAKARLDIRYQRHWKLCLDCAIIGRTIMCIFRY